MVPRSLPTRFIDPSRHSRKLNLLQRRYYGGDPTPSPEQARSLGMLLWEGDPLADALVAEWAEAGGVATGRRQLDLALEHGLSACEDPSPALRALIEQVERAPLWLDRRQLELGRRTGVRVGAAGNYVLSNVSLMGGYSFSAPTKPLVFTGALEQRTARRLGETAKFVCDVYAPDGLSRFGRGFISTVRVRVMHALVRRSLDRSERWRHGDWGLPINQADMLGTNLLFSMVYLTGLRAMGMRFTRDESEALIHLWRYVGYLIGVDEARLPATELEARRVGFAIFESQPRADDDSRRLARALQETPARMARTPLQRRLAELDARYRAGISRVVLGDRTADSLELPDDGFKFLMALTTPATFALETVRRTTPGLTDLAVRLGQAGLDRHVERVTAAGPVDFMPSGGARPQAA